MPTDLAARHEAMDQFGLRLHAALLDGAPAEVLMGDDELRRVLDARGVSRVAARRAMGSLSAGARVSMPLSDTHYLGVCLQDAREEGEWSAVPLRGTGWTFRRVLVVARRATGRRVALWVDGLFVFTDAGFVAVDLERVEDPRVEHSDLEIAPCDMATHLR